MTTPFVLHPRLAEDCLTIGHFELCRLLLMNDSHYPWFILVPQIPALREIYQLSKIQRDQLGDESCYLAEHLAVSFQADKINVAAIGNLVPQLHIHHVVRYQNDIAWPKPVWGFTSATHYNLEQLQVLQSRLRTILPLCQFNDRSQHL